MEWEMRSLTESVAITGNCTANGKWEMRSVESRNEIDRVASLEIALQRAWHLFLQMATWWRTRMRAWLVMYAP